MAFVGHVQLFSDPEYTFQPLVKPIVQTLTKPINQVGKTIISPSGRLNLQSPVQINCPPGPQRPEIFAIPQAAPDFNVGDFPAVITPQNIEQTQEFNLGADIQAQIQSILNPQELALTVRNRSQLAILQALDINKLRESDQPRQGYSQSELVRIARELGLPYNARTKLQLRDQILENYQAYRA